jgi:hypothetical protein
LTIEVDAPSFEEVLEQIFEVQTSDLRVAIPAEASNFDRSTKTVTVQSWVVENPDLPIMQNVPVVFSGLVWDIEDGQSGLLVAGDKRWISAWRSGSRQVPEDSGSHEYDYAVFIPGLRNKADSEAFIVGSGETICAQLSSGDLLLGDDSAADYLVLGTSFDSALDTYLTAEAVWVEAVRSEILTLGGNIDAATSTYDNAITALKNATILSTDVKTK